MNIGHYAPDLWAPGGVSTYVRRLGNAQEDAGSTVYYFSRTPPRDEVDTAIVVPDDGALFHRARTLGLDVLHLHKPVAELPAEPLPLVRTMHDNMAACPSGTRYLARSGRPCHRTYGVPGCLWGHLVDHCGSRRPRKMAGNFTRIERERRVLPQMPTITVSRFLKDWMVRTGYPEERIHVVHSPAPAAVDPYSPPPKGDPARFVFMGRLVPHKGPDWLLRAAARVRDPIHIDVAGAGPERPALEQLAGTLGITERVTFHGWLNEDPLRALVCDARAVVFPSVWHEPAGLVSLEAAAYGRPLVASRVGGVPEYTSDEHAFLVPPRDTDQLADRIAYLAEHRDVAARMGHAGRQWVDANFSMHRFLDRVHDVYRRARKRRTAGDDEKESVAPPPCAH